MAHAILPLLLAALAAPDGARPAPLPPGATAPVAVTPADRDWQPFGLVHRAAIRGDLLERACASATLVRLRPDTRLPPHAAPSARSFVVLSGTLQLGIGDTWDEGRLRTLPPGSFWAVPAGTRTFERAEGEVVAAVVVPQAGAECPAPGAPRVVTPDRVPWATAGAAERAVLAGDPDSPDCPSSVRWRLPAGAAIPVTAGRASGDEFHTVLVGRIAAAAGASADLPEGSALVLPRGSGATARATAPSVVQVDFLGPSHPACAWLEFARARPGR